jgi:acyl-CoA synthetase (AMP-forming)/AMP-acid ligase II
MRLHDYLDYYAAIIPAGPFSSFDGHRLTYAGAAALAHGYAAALLRAGIGPGDRVALLSRNCDLFVGIVAAISRIGAVAVPLNYRLSAMEISGILTDSGAAVLLAQGRELDRLRADGWTAPCPAIMVETVGAEVASPPAHASSPDDIVLQMYTSGTSGKPKGVQISHDTLLTNAYQLEVAIPYRLSRGDRYLLVCPMYHAAALISAVMTLRAGGEMVIHADFEAGAVVGALANDGIAAATLVPAMMARCVQWADGQARDFASLRHILYGASPIAPDVLARAMRLFDCQMTQAFGLTETTAAATALTAEDHVAALDDAALLASCGRALIGTEIAILDAAEPGGIGEIAVRGPQVMRGYAGLPDTTAAAVVGGWFHTGDAGTLDSQGYLTIRDRLKDMIISGGENIYSIEVENALMTHPQIVEAAVIGVPDAALGEVQMAFIVVANDYPGDADVIAHCRSLLAGYKIPRRYGLIEVLPRNPSGKVLKGQLREAFWQGSGRAVA